MAKTLCIGAAPCEERKAKTELRAPRRAHVTRQGAQSALYAATAPQLHGKGGIYIGPQVRGLLPPHRRPQQPAPSHAPTVLHRPRTPGLWTAQACHHLPLVSQQPAPLALQAGPPRQAGCARACGMTPLLISHSIALLHPAVAAHPPLKPPIPTEIILPQFHRTAALHNGGQSAAGAGPALALAIPNTVLPPIPAVLDQHVPLKRALGPKPRRLRLCETA
jgi:hypothetical protein